MIGEPDAGNPHVRFDEGRQETCVRAARLSPTLLALASKKVSFLIDLRPSIPPSPRTPRRVRFGVGQTAGELSRKLAKFTIGFADPRSGLYDLAY